MKPRPTVDHVKTYGPKLSSLLSDGTGDGGTLHFTLGVDNDTGVVLEVEEDAVCAAPWLGLADNDGGHDLLPELRLSLLDGGHDHVTDTTGGETVEACTDTLDGDDVEVTGSGVVGAVHDGSAVVNVLAGYVPLPDVETVCAFVCAAHVGKRQVEISVRV